MTDQQIKIHTLGAKRNSMSAKILASTASQKGFNLTQPAPVYVHPAPVPSVQKIVSPIIKYIYVQNPEYDKLVKQLSILRVQYEDLMKKHNESQNQQNREFITENIKEVIQSTKEIQMKMSRMVNVSHKVNENQKENKQLTKQVNVNKVESYQCFNKEKKANHEQQCIQIIETVNLATQKIQQLQQKTVKLQKQVINQKQWKQALEKQNQRLRKMLEDKENQKKIQVQSLKYQINKLKEKQVEVKQIQGRSIEVNMKKNKQTLPISQIDINEINQSRLTVNTVQNSSRVTSRVRKSLIYE